MNKTQSKVCKKCSIERPLANFYEKKDRVCGYDNTCKECRSSERKARYQRHKVKIIPPKRIIEPKTCIPEQAASQAKKMDFNDMEKFYGKKLTTIEKHDAVERLNEFVRILLDGYSEIKGQEIYVRKD